MDEPGRPKRGIASLPRRSVRPDGAQAGRDTKSSPWPGCSAEGNTCHPTTLYFLRQRPVWSTTSPRRPASFPDTSRESTQRQRSQWKSAQDTRAVTHRSPNEDVEIGSAAAADGGRGRPHRCGASDWAERLGILGRRRPPKRFPSDVFRLRDADLELFLGRLWAGDGFIANRTLTVPFYATSSHGLAADVQTLLLRLGIVRADPRKSVHLPRESPAGFRSTFWVKSRSRPFQRIAPHCLGRDAPWRCSRTSATTAGD